MNVKELIKKLSDFPPDIEVICEDAEWEYRDIVEIKLEERRINAKKTEQYVMIY